MAYLSVADLKKYTDIPSLTTEDDALIEDLIASAQQWIDQYCGQTFEANADSTRYLSAASIEHGGNVSGKDLVLPGPLAAITSITNGDGVEVESSEYVTFPANRTPYHEIRLLGSSGKSWTYTNDPENAIVIVGRWAYSTSPNDTIVQATRRLAIWFYRQRENGNDLDRAIAVGNMTVLPSRLPSDLLDLLRHYRRRSISY